MVGPLLKYRNFVSRIVPFVFLVMSRRTSRSHAFPNFIVHSICRRVPFLFDLNNNALLECECRSFALNCGENNRNLFGFGATVCEATVTV